MCKEPGKARILCRRQGTIAKLPGPESRSLAIVTDDFDLLTEETMGAAVFRDLSLRILRPGTRVLILITEEKARSEICEHENPPLEKVNEQLLGR